VPSTLGLLQGMVTYIIDKKGRVRHIFSSQLNAAKHIKEAIKIINEISKE
jgi:peroxiredoxin Q/BCP